MIQFDEPAFNVYFDEVRDWGVAALERAAQGLTCTTAVHICYGYGIKANIDWKKTLGSEWRQYEQTFPLLAQSAIDQVSLECANSHVPLDLLALLAGKDVLVGRDRRRHGPGRDPGGGRRDHPRGTEVRSRRAPVSLHQLRHGAAVAGRGPRKADGRWRPARRWSEVSLDGSRQGLLGPGATFPTPAIGYSQTSGKNGVHSQRCFVSSTRARLYAVSNRSRYSYISVLENETWGGHPPADYLS